MIRRLLARRRAARRRAQVVADLAALFAPVLDELAAAYDADPVSVGRLLRLHARAVLTWDHAVVSPYATDVQRMVARAEVDGSRAALLSVSPAAAGLDTALSREACMRLADDLTARAAGIHINAPGGNL